MGRLKTITRRSFMVGSAALAGGVAFGFYTVRRPHENPLLENLAADEAALTPWIKIDDQDIILITPHTDLGQGAYSMQAALIAEELDVEFGEFKVSPGVPSAAYYNTSMGGELAPFMSTDESFMANTMRGTMNTVGKVMGLQGTGGSSAVPDSFDKLRYAGAVARETLKLAASQETGVPVSDLRTSNGHVILPNGQRLSYQNLASTAASIDLVDDVELKEPHRWRLIGKEMMRLDTVPKATGTLKYGIDLKMDDMLYATVKLNPRQGGGLNSYDARTAEGMTGVERIMPVTGGVAVVAGNTWHAIQAANAIEFDWGEAAYPPEMQEHWEILSNSFKDENLDRQWRDDGDIESGLENADSILEAEYRAPYVAHAPLEPLNAIVRVAGDRVDVWSAQQIPRMVQNNVARIANVESEQVYLHNQYAGGSFGHRLEDEHVKLATEVALQFPGVPVKLTYSREEDVVHDFPRHIGMARMKGVTNEGQVESVDLAIASPSNLASQASRQVELPVFGPDGQIVAGAWNLPYSIPNFRVKGYKAEGLAPVSSWRSVGASTNAFFADGFLDELIAEAGSDPLEERLRLCNHSVSRAVLEAVGEMSNWGSPMGPNRGRGVAFCESFGVPTAEVVEVTNTDQGIRIDKVYGVADVGRVVDPINFENHFMGAIVWGLGHAIDCEITYTDGMAQQNNFHQFQPMRMYQCPDIEVRGLENAEKIRGIGEPPVPPAPAALANAIFAATGMRLREMPFRKSIDFV